MTDEICSVEGLTILVKDNQAESGVHYDIGIIADQAVRALKVAVLAIEQVVTGEQLIESLDIGDFYSYLNRIIEESNGQGILSESGAIAELQDELQAVIDIITLALKHDPGRNREHE